MLRFTLQLQQRLSLDMDTELQNSDPDLNFPPVQGPFGCKYSCTASRDVKIKWVAPTQPARYDLSGRVSQRYFKYTPG